ncbi:AraC family ligand binding domain-containing protein [Paenibacillus sp. CAU 1782]
MKPLPIRWPIDRSRFEWIGIEARIINLGMEQPPFAVASYALWLIHGGSGIAAIDGQPVHLHKSHCMLLSPGTSVEFQVSSGQMLHMNEVSFDVRISDVELSSPDGDAFAEGTGSDGGNSVMLNLDANVPFNVHPLAFFIKKMDEISQYRDAVSGLEQFKRLILLQEFVMVNEQERGAKASFSRLGKSEYWRSLKAVRSGRVHEVPYARWWMYSPLAAEGQDVGTILL